LGCQLFASGNQCFKGGGINRQTEFLDGSRTGSDATTLSHGVQRDCRRMRNFGRRIVQVCNTTVK